MSKFIDSKTVEQKAAGGWRGIVSHLAGGFFEVPLALRDGVKTTCPGCGKKEGFRFFKDFSDTGGGVCDRCGFFKNGLSLLIWATEKPFFEVLSDVATVLGGGEFSESPQQRAAKQLASQKRAETEDKVAIGRLRAAYATSIRASAKGSLLVQHYMASRGLDPSLLALAGKHIRFHPEMSYLHADETRENLPAMLAMVTAPDDSAVTIHRTFLDPITGRKASVPDPKRLMSHTSVTTLKGAAIRLAPVDGDTMGVTEGIETAWAAMQGTSLPVWATISAIFMEHFVPPEGVKKVIVFADKDRSQTGQNSAVKLVERLWALGIQAHIELPPCEIPDGTKGVDWLDVLNLHGVAAFPKVANDQ